MMILHQVPGTKEPQGREAKTIAVDKVHDVALLRITGTPLPALPLGSAMARDGQEVAFTGFPLGTALGFHPVTHRGIVAALVPAVMTPSPITETVVSPRLKSALKVRRGATIR